MSNTKKEKLPPIEDLHYSAIDVKPRNYDWSEGYTERWDFHVASRCEECGEIVVGRGGDQHCDIDDESECQGYIPQSDGPMMSYFYPLPCFDMDVDEAAKAIVDLPLCIVEFTDYTEDDDRYALALTGGGMDRSWEICEAFMRLGSLPPAHFADLPEFAGVNYKRSARHQWIINAMLRSVDCMASRYERSYSRIIEKFGYRKPKTAKKK